MSRRTRPAAAVLRAVGRPVHPFAAEPGMTDWRGNPLCGHQGCGQPRDRPIHRLPDVDPAVSQAERQRLGEREEPE